MSLNSIIFSILFQYTKRYRSFTVTIPQYLPTLLQQWILISTLLYNNCKTTYLHKVKLRVIDYICKHGTNIKEENIIENELLLKERKKAKKTGDKTNPILNKRLKQKAYFGEMKCPFRLKVFCFSHDKCWYVQYQQSKYFNNCSKHSGHTPMLKSAITQSIKRKRQRIT